MRKADNLTNFLCRLSRNSGTSASWKPKGLSRPVAGKLYLTQGVLCERIHQLVLKYGLLQRVSGNILEGSTESLTTTTENLSFENLDITYSAMNTIVTQVLRFLRIFRSIIFTRFIPPYLYCVPRLSHLLGVHYQNSI